MGIYDREYYQEDSSQQGLFGSIRQWPWSYRLIAFFVVIFFLDHLIPSSSRGGGMGGPGVIAEWCVYDPISTFSHGQIWRILTSVIIELEPFQLLLSMVALYFFGPMMEGMLGRPKFLIYFLLCHIGGVIAGTVLSQVFFGSWPFFFGTGGGLIGLIIAAGIIVPQQPVLLIVIPMTMYWLAVVSVVIDAAFAISGNPLAICYLGAAFTGFVLTKTRRVSLDWIDRYSWRTSVGRRGSFPTTIPFSKIGSAFSPKPVSEEELDRLLDKVHAHGIESLTTRENRLSNEQPSNAGIVRTHSESEPRIRTPFS